MPSTPTLRFADSDTARRFPLAVQGPARWQQQEGAWRVRLPLPALGAGTILVPSFAASPAPAGLPAAAGTEPPARHQWLLSAQGGTWALPQLPAPGPAAASATVPPSTGGAVSSHIDCFHVHRHLTGGELLLSLTSAAEPRHYLVAASTRPLTIADPPLPDADVALTQVPQPRSQMSAPQPIAHRICSPTCVSMVLGLWGRQHDWLTLAEECHDPRSGMYGVWPLALAAASRRGCLGSVEVFSDWGEPLAVLARGIPLVTSIRFRCAELPGAPLTETGGHLVVMHAASPHTIGVCDPAAPDGEVLREYPAAAFSQAWLRHRGAAYILPP